MRLQDGSSNSLTPQVPTSKADFEAGRLDTFDDKWPHADKSLCSKLSMAQAGFFYCGRNDMVQCFDCGIKLQGWDPQEDRPWQKHHKTCLFGSKAKREGELTLEELLDIFADKAQHIVASRLSKLI